MTINGKRNDNGPRAVIGLSVGQKFRTGGETKFRAWIWGWDRSLIAVIQARCS